MTDIIGGVLIAIGGGMLTGSSMRQLRWSKSSIAAARELLGNSDAAVPRRMPADIQLLIQQLD